MSADIDVRKLA